MNSIFFLLSLVQTSIGLEPLSVQEIQIGAQKIEVEVADELHERRLGLMHRQSMEENHGMIFVYPAAEERSFWMKNTYISLTIAYIGSDCSIVHLTDMVPLSTKGVPSVLPAQFALEMNQGWFRKNNVKVGDVLKGIEHCQ